MKVHRKDTPERRHYVPEARKRLTLRPELLYAGALTKSPAWSDEAHRHEFCEIMLVCSGKGLLRSGGREYKLTAGDLVIYNAGCEHSERSDGSDPMEMVFAGFRGAIVSGLPKDCLIAEDASCVVPAGGLAADIEDFIRRMIRETEAKGLYHAEISQSLLSAALLTVFKALSKGGKPYVEVNDTYAAAKRYIDENFASELTLGGICEKLYVNKYYFSHLFKEAAGMTVMNYVVQRRILEAKRLLAESDFSVKKVAASVGYLDPAHFCRLFKRREGLTPTEYREGAKSADLR